MKKSKKKAFHTSSSSMATGDFYGSGIKNPSGKLRFSYMSESSDSRKMGKPPKSYA